MKDNYKIAVVIPFYNASKHIVNVVRKLPDFIDHIYIINDCSEEHLPFKSLDGFNKISFLNHSVNSGVGGATKTGFIKAIEDKMDFIVKVDADDQMNTSYLNDLLNPLINKNASYAKGNRFKDFKALKKMPLGRKMGNVILSFLTKAATGYWYNFDPTNGFFAIDTNILKKIDFENVSNRYYFETSLIAELYFQNVIIKDVSMPAIYGTEKSNMKVWMMPFVFLPKLFKTFVKRLFKTYFIYDFNITSIYLLFGIPLFLFGMFYGSYNWYYYASNNTFAPTGTIMLVTLTIIIGFQLLLQAIQNDINKAPKF